jgi:diaminohydroxyphosphoribosylaminopyrimidine deaminase/5-amino-6-(5-phosphoribosylamino)uracil reductase
MKRALRLADKATRSVLPNPTVGAVLVVEGRVIGEGYHERFGGPHAEVNAIAAVKDRQLLAKSTLYVTLEPCSHTGKTPPCVDLILTSKIRRVVIGCRDPYPQVAGRGIQALQDAGVDVTEGVLHDECVVANSRFILAHKMRRPYIILKWAQTSNGLLAPPSGEPTPISSAYSQALLHYWRGQEMAIAVGSNTARVDNPSLTARHLNVYRNDELPPRQPTRVIIGDASRLPENLALWTPDAPTMVFFPAQGPHNINTHNARVWHYDPGQSLVTQVCRALYEQRLLSVIVEGGAVTLQSFIDADLWDEIRVFSAPFSFPSGKAAPLLPHRPHLVTTSGPDTLELIAHPQLASRLGIQDCSITPLLASAIQPLSLRPPCS